MRSFPVVGMGSSPSPYTLHIRRTPEVIAVLRLTQPTALTARLAGLAAGWFRTVVLVAQIARIGPEQFTAMPTLTSSVAFHRWDLPSTLMMGNHADDARQNASKTRRERKSKKADIDKKKEEKDRNTERQKKIEKIIFYRFKPPIQLPFRNGAATA